MPGKAATPAERKLALEIYVTDGPSEAGRRTGFSKGAVCNWAKKAGLRTEAPQLLGEAAKVSAERRKMSMAKWREEMLEELRTLSIAAATLEGELLSQRGKQTPSLDRVTSVRVKAVSDLLLLSGEATQRIGLSGDQSEQTAKIAQLRDELAERRLKAV